MDVIKIRPWTVTGLFLGGMFLAVGMLFTIAFWHEASREPVWIGAALAGLGEAGKSAYWLRQACSSTLFSLGDDSPLVPVGHTQETTR